MTVSAICGYWLRISYRLTYGSEKFSLYTCSQEHMVSGLAEIGPLSLMYYCILLEKRLSDIKWTARGNQVFSITMTRGCDLLQPPITGFVSPLHVNLAMHFVSIRKSCLDLLETILYFLAMEPDIFSCWFQKSTTDDTSNHFRLTA